MSERQKVQLVWPNAQTNLSPIVCGIDAPNDQAVHRKPELAARPGQPGHWLGRLDSRLPATWQTPPRKTLSRFNILQIAGSLPDRCRSIAGISGRWPARPAPARRRRCCLQVAFTNDDHDFRHPVRIAAGFRDDAIVNW